MAKRIAVLDREICKPSICNFLCKNVCPVNRSGDECVTINELDKKPLIEEILCIGCGICSHKCPVKAISIVNLPSQLEESPIHRYGRNQFVLYRLPVPKNKMVVGLIGQNGVGKSTAIKILSNELRPNTGVLDKEIPFEEVIEKFKGSELFNYLTELKDGKVKVAYKPQNVDAIPKMWKGKVSRLLESAAGDSDYSRVKALNLGDILDKEVKNLSGGELQLIAVAATILKEADLYFFDEPSSYLDVEQRLLVAQEIRKISEKSMVIVIEHDLAVADYLADHVHILFGKPACFGIISKPYGVRNGINTYLEGHIKEENVRFRKEGIIFNTSSTRYQPTKKLLDFPSFTKNFEKFSLSTEKGTLYKGEIIGILGPNATGKSTFIKMLTGDVKPEKGEKLKDLKLSYKPQRIDLTKEEEATDVRDYLSQEMDSFSSKAGKRILHSLEIDRLMEKKLGTLSGGELQAVKIAAALGKDFDILLLDEPTAFLDVEQRLRAGKTVKEIVEEKEVAAFIVDHDLQILDSMADRVMVFDGKRGVSGIGKAPSQPKEGMNSFLKKINVTFRRDPHTGRARANKLGSVLDREQKEKGQYYYDN